MATKEKFLPEVDPDIDYEFQLLGSNRLNYGIGRQAVVYNPVTEEETQLRYVPGWKSVIKEEQPEVDEHLIPGYDINFSKGRLIVPGTKKQLVQFLLLHNEFDGNKHAINVSEPSYKLTNKQAELANTRKMITARREAISMAEDAGASEMYPFARVIGITLGKKKGEKDSEYEDRIRTEFMSKAEADPINFKERFSDPRHKREYDVILGFEQGILDDTNDREVVWSDSKESILKIPSTVQMSAQTSIKYLTDFSLTEKGADFYQALKKQIKY